MIYTAPPDNFAYLEALNSEELFYMKYNEVKSDREKVMKLLSEVENPRMFIIPEVYDDIKEQGVRTLFDDFYKHDITIRKHTRYSPDIMHDHTFFEMIYILKGKADNTVENQLYKMTDGDICLLPPNIYHKLWVDDDSVVINIIMKKSLFTDMFFEMITPGSQLLRFIKQNLYMQPLGERKFHMYHSLHNPSLRNILAALVSEAFKGQNSVHIKKALMISVFNYLTNNNEGNDDYANSDKSEIANTILEYIQMNYATATLSDAAKHFNYSEPYLSKLIQNITGGTFIGILQKTRLKEACHLLATTSYRIGDIPGLVGYDSTVYFNRVFKQKIGTSPLKYRKMHKNTSLNRADDFMQ